LRILVGFVRSVNKLNKWIANIASFLIFPMAGILFIEVICRYFFNNPTIWAYSLATIIYAIYLCLGGSYAALTGSHVRMDLFYSKWSKTTKAKVDICTYFIALAFFIPFLIASWSMGIQSVVTLERVNAVWRVFTFPWKIAVALGTTLLFLQITAKLCNDIHIIKTKEDIK